MLDVAVDSSSDVSSSLKLSLMLPTDDATFKGIALVCRLILFVPVLPSCVRKFLACKRHFVMATKSSPTVALEPLPGADPAIRSIMLTTEPISLTDAFNAFGDIDLTALSNRSSGCSVTLDFPETTVEALP
uniref:Uncharacterized protein n=1 Tax=Opuntia streptacantha TaxID=393608 RepID=A0A7C9D3Y1_OPUST